MAEPTLDPNLRQALQELQSYLSDQIAPLMVADSIDQLSVSPPELTATAIEAWVAAQFRVGDQGASVPDYLFHAMKKILSLAHLKLLEREPLLKYLDAVGRIVIRMCPAGDRDSFKEMLASLAKTDIEMAPAVNLMHMQAGGGAALRGGAKRSGPAQGGDAPSEELQRGLKRFTLMLERLERGAGAEEGKAGPEGPRAELVSHLLATAALNSRSGADLERHMASLSRIGVGARAEEIFKALSSSLPGWTLPAAMIDSAEALPGAASRPAEAMRRFVSIAENPAEGLARFSEMVKVAVQQFNEGHLSQAASMLDIARRLMIDRKVDAEGAASVLARAHEGLSEEYLRGCSENAEKHPLLRRVIGFFPALSVDALLAALNGEPKRELRKLRLALLEAHGASARTAALGQLELQIANDTQDPHGYYIRNLVVLLRRIPRPAEADPEREVAILSELARWGTRVVLAKEVVGALGQYRTPKSEAALRTRMKEYEEALLNESALAGGDAADLRSLLDRAAFALARMGTPNAWRTVLNHATSGNPAFGEAEARVAELGSQDLSADKELVALLISTLRAELPKKMLGFVIQKRSHLAQHLVAALGGTRTPAVKSLLEEIVSRYPGQELAGVAAKSLQGYAPAKPSADAAAPQAVGLAGDLDLFGLPALVQTVADAKMTGGLTLSDRAGKPMATATFSEGKILDCRIGSLAGVEAFYQLFERPMAGTFVFKSQKEAPAPEEGAAPIEVLPEMLEAMRRHDELQQARAIVPDDGAYAATATRPEGPPDGEDPELLRAVWERASTGMTPAACEGAVAADCYRIRRLYAHWVEQGALLPK